MKYKDNNMKSHKEKFKCDLCCFQGNSNKMARPTNYFTKPYPYSICGKVFSRTQCKVLIWKQMRNLTM